MDEKKKEQVEMVLEALGFDKGLLHTHKDWDEIQLRAQITPWYWKRGSVLTRKKIKPEAGRTLSAFDGNLYYILQSEAWAIKEGMDIFNRGTVEEIHVWGSCDITDLFNILVYYSDYSNLDGQGRIGVLTYLKDILVKENLNVGSWNIDLDEVFGDE